MSVNDFLPPPPPPPSPPQATSTATVSVRLTACRERQRAVRDLNSLGGDIGGTSSGLGSRRLIADAGTCGAIGPGTRRRSARRPRPPAARTAERRRSRSRSGGLRV